MQLLYRKLLFLSSAVLLLLGMLICVQNSAFATVYYVDAGANGSGTEDNPFGTIQQAADIAKPGDTVLVRPGVYYESVDIKNSGTEEKPIVFRADKKNGEEVIITGANKDIREKRVKWTLEDEEKQIYSVPYKRNVGSMLYNGAMIFGCYDYESLETYHYENYPLPKHCYYWDSEEEKLYVRLRSDEKYGSVNPNNNLMCVGGPYYDTINLNGRDEEGWRSSGVGEESYNIGIWTEGPAYIVLHGFNFETPGYFGVFIRGSHVTVSNCTFRGCHGGITGGSRSWYDEYLTTDVTVENCDWSCFPTYEDTIEQMEETPPGTYSHMFIWWMKSGRGGLFDYETGTFISKAGKNFIVRNNVISSCLDGLSYNFNQCYFKQLGTYGVYGDSQTVSGGDHEIYGNKFYNIIDNAIEFEDHAKNIKFHNNEIIDVYQPVSWQPLRGYPLPTNLEVYENIVYTQPEVTELWLKHDQSASTFTKIGQNQSSFLKNPWTKDLPWDYTVSDGGRSVKQVHLPDKGLVFHHNTVIIPKGYVNTFPGRRGTETRMNVHYYNNIFYTYFEDGNGWYKSQYEVGTFLPKSYNGFEYAGNIMIAPCNFDVEFKADSYTYKNSYAYKSLAAAGLKREGYTFVPTKGSKAVNGGVSLYYDMKNSTHIGALKYGEHWKLNYGVFPYGDVNYDGIVNEADIMSLSENIGIDNPVPSSDLNFDSVTDDADLQTLIGEIMEVTAQ